MWYFYYVCALELCGFLKTISVQLLLPPINMGTCAAGAYTNRLCAAQVSLDWLKPAQTSFTSADWGRGGGFIGLCGLEGATYHADLIYNVYVKYNL